MEKRMKIDAVISNDNNPRQIRDQRYLDLLKEIEDFPEMSDARPLVINMENLVLGGNQRLRAMKELGWKTVPVSKVDWSEAKQRRFILLDNAHYGDWDYIALKENWSDIEMQPLGIDIGFEDEDDMYYPTLTSATNYSDVTKEDMERQSKSLAEQMNSEQNFFNITCPNCAHDFNIQK